MIILTQSCSDKPRVLASSTKDSNENEVKEFKRIDEMLVKEGFLGVMTTFLSDEKDFGQWYYRKDPTHVAFYRPETFEVIASMMDWTYEIPEKDVVLFKK
mgnify:CR=1 FL=1